MAESGQRTRRLEGAPRGWTRGRKGRTHHGCSTGTGPGSRPTAGGREGADIIAIDICRQIESNPYPLATPEDLAETARLVEAEGRACVAVQADVRERSELVAAAQQGLDRLGHLDIVVANAGILPTGANKGPEAFLDALDVDLIGVMNTVAATVPSLPDGASVIITGSTAGMMPWAPPTTPCSGPGGAGYGYAEASAAAVRRGDGAAAGVEVHPLERRPPDQHEHPSAPPRRPLPCVRPRPGARRRVPTSSRRS